MKRYRARQGSIADVFLKTVFPMMAMIGMIILTGLGNHFIDGM